MSLVGYYVHQHVEEDLFTSAANSEHILIAHCLHGITWLTTPWGFADSVSHMLLSALQSKPCRSDLKGVAFLCPVTHSVHDILPSLIHPKQPLALPKCSKPALPLPHTRQLEEASGVQEGL